MSTLRLSALVGLCFGLLACGGAQRGATPTTGNAPVAAVAETPASPPPCTLWDPDADPLLPPGDVAEAPERARRSLSGLRWCVLRPGTGDTHPTDDDRVLVHYTGWTTDGHMFDSSHSRGEPTVLPVNGVITGWREGLQLMTPGEVRRFWIPQSLAYGGTRRPFGVLVFDVELIRIEE